MAAAGVHNDVIFEAALVASATFEYEDLGKREKRFGAAHEMEPPGPL